MVVHVGTKGKDPQALGRIGPWPNSDNLTHQQRAVFHAGQFIDAAQGLRNDGLGIVWLADKEPVAKQWPLASKEPEDYRSGLNLGILTGKLSGDAVCVDLDSLGVLELADDYLPTTDMVDGRPGKPRSHRFYRVTDIPPHLTSTAAGGIGGLKTRHFKGIDLLGTGSLAVVPPSLHRASGERRVWETYGPPRLIPAEDLVAAVTELFRACGETENREPCNREDRDNISYSLSSLSSLLQIAELAILATLPTAPGQRWRKQFSFARYLKSIPELANLPVRELRPIVQEWHRRCLGVIRTKPFLATWEDFISSWEAVKFPLGAGPVNSAFKAARVAMAPSALLQLYDGAEQIILLAKLCRELQAIAGDDWFYLDCRSAARLIGTEHTAAWRHLRTLCADGVLKAGEKGNTGGRSSRFRYVLGTEVHS